MKMTKEVTPAVIAANRRNAAQSTGPRTDAGKTVVAQNAIKHGLLCQALILEDEEQKKEFEQLVKDLVEDFKPVGKLEEMLVEEIAVSWWMLRVALHSQISALRSQRKTSSAILESFLSSSRNIRFLYSNYDALRSIADCGGEFREVVLKVCDNKFDEEKKSPLVRDEVTEKRARVEFEAKLGSSAESMLRYQSAWKRDLFRAITLLTMLQSERLTITGAEQS